MVFGLVLSHWLLDFIAHRPDMPILPSGPHVGLGMWNNLLMTIIVESGLMAMGVYLYFHATRRKVKTGTYIIVALVALLYLIFFANLFGPPPPSVIALAMSANLMWIFVGIAYWGDRRRQAIAA